MYNGVGNRSIGNISKRKMEEANEKIESKNCSNCSRDSVFGISGGEYRGSESAGGIRSEIKSKKGDCF